MKRFSKLSITVLFLLVFLIGGFFSVYGQKNDLKLNFAVEVPQLDLRFGVEYRANNTFGRAADIGTTLMTLEGNFAISYDVTPVIYITDSVSGVPVNIDLVFGITDAMLVFTSPLAHMWNLGADLRASLKVTDTLSLGTEIGAGYPLFLEGSQFRYGSNYFLGLWPHFEIFGQYGL